MSYPDQHRFAMQVAQLSRAWRSELDRRLVGLGLSQARWLVLLHLARFSEMPTQRELAQSVGVEGRRWRVYSTVSKVRGWLLAWQYPKTAVPRRSRCSRMRSL